MNNLPCSLGEKKKTALTHTLLWSLRLHRLRFGYPGYRGFCCFLVLSLRVSQVAQQATAYPGFRSRKRLGVFLLPLDGMLVHRRVVGTNLYTWVEGGTVRVKCLTQEHNTMPLANSWIRS